MPDVAARVCICNTSPIFYLHQSGIFLKAKQAGLIAEIRPLLEALVETGFRLDGATLNALLDLAGEL